MLLLISKIFIKNSLLHTMFTFSLLRVKILSIFYRLHLLHYYSSRNINTKRFASRIGRLLIGSQDQDPK